MQSITDWVDNAGFRRAPFLPFWNESIRDWRQERTAVRTHGPKGSLKAQAGIDGLCVERNIKGGVVDQAAWGSGLTVRYLYPRRN